MNRATTRSKARAQTRKKPQPKTAPETVGPLTGAKLKTILCVVLAAATIGLYSPVIGHGFVKWDDQHYVTANSHIHGGLTWDTVKWAFRSTEESNWHPLTWLSHALDYQLFGLNATGHHLGSVLIHASNAALLFLLLAWVTKRVGPSALVAALFALHPINVESVAWVAERKNVLSTLFFILAIAAYVWYAQKPEWRRYLLVAALFAAGLMAKPMVITFPFVLLLLDYWPLERMPLDGTASSPVTSGSTTRPWLRSLLLEKVPLLFLSAASAGITLIAQGNAERTFEEFPFDIRVENAVVAYALYLWKMLWPARLALYPHSAIALPAWQWILSILVLATVTAFVVICRRKRYLPVGWFWFLGTLVPVIGLVQVGEASMADRYAYIPMIGIFIMIAWGFADWAEARKISTVWRVLPAVCALAALSSVTHRQISYWESDYDLWSHALAVGESGFAQNAVAADLMNPEQAMTQHDLQNFSTEQERMDEARLHFERALELRRPLAQQSPGVYLPEMASTLTSLGTLDRIRNRPDEARQHDEEALRIVRPLAQRDPDKYRSYLAGPLVNLGDLDQLQNRPDEARQHYEEALQCYRQLARRDPDSYLPNTATTLSNLADVDRSQNRRDEAQQHLEDALGIYRQLAQQNPDKYLPGVARALYNLGFLDGMQNRLDEARHHYEEALKLYGQLAQQNADYLPFLAVTLNDLASVDRLQNRIDNARQHSEEALKAYRQLARRDPAEYLPQVARALSNLGFLDGNENQIEEARGHYQEALMLLRKLSQVDKRYASDAARVEASLRELNNKKIHSQ
ncbi:MAG: tetratricopeptide repeat protein [Terriglobales bacterium]